MAGKAVVALMAAGTAISAYGAYQQGKMQKEMYEYNARVAEENAKIAQQKADYDKEQFRRRYRKIAGSQRVAYAKGGVDSSTGTPLYVQEELAMLTEEDILMTQYNADLKKRGYTVEAATARYQGAAAYSAGKMRAAGTLLTGGGQTMQTGYELEVFG
jgi:hypothetical protein